jgi:hypothetical protein
MTWKNIVTDNGSYDLNPAAGVVTFRVCSVRAAETTGDKGSGGGWTRPQGQAASPRRCCCFSRWFRHSRSEAKGGRNRGSARICGATFYFRI